MCASPLVFFILALLESLKPFSSYMYVVISIFHFSIPSRTLSLLPHAGDLYHTPFTCIRWPLLHHDLSPEIKEVGAWWDESRQAGRRELQSG
jgi:hypothetical protein